MQHENRERMDQVAGEAAEMAARPTGKKLAAVAGIWVPGGLGYNHMHRPKSNVSAVLG